VDYECPYNWITLRFYFCANPKQPRHCPFAQLDHRFVAFDQADEKKRCQILPSIPLPVSVQFGNSFLKLIGLPDLEGGLDGFLNGSDAVFRMEVLFKSFLDDLVGRFARKPLLNQATHRSGTR
jgi:hypothetical protein